jgi:mobilization protein NikA
MSDLPRDAPKKQPMLPEPMVPAPRPRKKGRSGSEKRQRADIISVRVKDHERLTIEANAAAVDLCASAFLRVIGTGQHRPNERRRPNPDMRQVGKLLAQCGRIGGNVHQLVKEMNFGGIPQADELQAAGREVRALVAATLKAFGL